MDIIKIINEEIEYMNEIYVYHGSDRKFDKFDMNKIGTGDGKALGGWGIYFSTSPEVSKRYVTKYGFLKKYNIKNGNYFDLDAIIDDGDNIISELRNSGIDDDIIDEFQSDFLDYDVVTNKQAYDWLSYVLGGEKEASLFLKSIGYIGNTAKDKWNIDARNYILFDTENILGEVSDDEDYDNYDY